MTVYPCSSLPCCPRRTNIVALGDKRIWGDAASQSPIAVESEATHSDHSVVTFNVLKGLGTQRYWA